jgi:hypothetical protein
MTMSKMLEATCVGGVVTQGGAPVPGADVLSEGIGASTGVLLLDDDQAVYVAKISPDLKSTLDGLITALTSISSALNALNTATLVTTCPAGAGVAGPPLVATSDIAVINSTKAQLQFLRGVLK